MTDYIRQYENPRNTFEEREVTRLLGEFETDARVDDGIVRWKSNGRVPPEDILRLWDHVGKPFEFLASLITQQVETEQFLTSYRRDYAGPSTEDIAEMRNEFGSGATIVNVITGTITKL